MLFIDDGLIHNKLKQTIDKTGLAKPLTSPSRSWPEPHILTVKKDPRNIDPTVSGKLFDSLHAVKSDAMLKDWENEIQYKFAAKTSEQDTNIGDAIYLNPVGSDVAGGTSLSVERKAECLDLQSLVKDLENQNQKLSEENEKLMKKLSVQTKVWAKLLPCSLCMLHVMWKYIVFTKQ